MAKFSAHFGKVVREVRLQRRLSQEILAERAQLDRTFVSMIERGIRNPTLETAKRLANALGIRLSKMIVKAERKEV